MQQITINGKSYEVTIDSFGIRYVDGMLINDFLKWLDINDPDGYQEVAVKGANIITNEPERAKDIIERNEITTLEPFL